MESISFMMRPLQFLNLTQWRLDQKTGVLYRNRFLELYTVLMIIFSVAFLLFGLFVDEDFNDSNNNDVGQTVDFIQLVGIRVAHILSILESLMRRQDQRKFFEKAHEIDRYFENTLNLNVDKREYRRKTLQRGAIMLVVYFGSELFIFITNLTSSNQHFSIFRIFYFWPFLVCGVRYFQIFIGITIIKNRLDLLVAALEQINLCHSNSKNVNFDSFIPTNILKWKIKSVPIYALSEHKNQQSDMENPHLKNLLNIRDLYNRLWELSNIVNRCVGVSLLINLGNDFLSITTNSYWIFVNFTSANTDYMTIAGTVIWSIPHVCNVLVLGILCDYTMHCTTAIALRLHQIECNNLNDNHNTVISQFSLQLIHQKITFTAAGFLKVDSALLYTIIGATTTYLIILIQFHLSG